MNSFYENDKFVIYKGSYQLNLINTVDVFQLITLYLLYKGHLPIAILCLMIHKIYTKHMLNW